MVSRTKTEGKKEVIKPTSRRKDNIKIDFKEIRHMRFLYVHLVQDIRLWGDLLYTVKKLWVQVDNFLHCCRPVSY
jgi:hypothetical protein